MATQNNEESFHMDRPDESDQEGRILETTFHEVKKRISLLEKKQQGLWIYTQDDNADPFPIHFNWWSVNWGPLHCYVVQEKINTQGEVIRRTEGKKYLDRNETEMTPEELQKFEEDWSSRSPRIRTTTKTTTTIRGSLGLSGTENLWSVDHPFLFCIN